MRDDEKLLVKLDLDWLQPRMTRGEARRYGEHHMPPDYKAAGCKVVVTRSNPNCLGGDWYRINYEPE